MAITYIIDAGMQIIGQLLDTAHGQLLIGPHGNVLAKYNDVAVKSTIDTHGICHGGGGDMRTDQQARDAYF